MKGDKGDPGQSLIGTIPALERVWISWRVSPEYLHIANSSLNTSVITRIFSEKDIPGVCHVILIS